MPIASLRWFWALGFVVLLPAGLGMVLLSLRSTSQLDGPEQWTIESRWLLGLGAVVCVAALFSLGGYVARLRYDLRAKKADAPVTNQP